MVKINGKFTGVATSSKPASYPKTPIRVSVILEPVIMGIPVTVVPSILLILVISSVSITYLAPMIKAQFEF